VLETIRSHLKPGQPIFIGVTDPIDPAIETAEQACPARR
jgi:5-methyltetrahydropteroyltriglutamate--homocysteine methyltransferase